MKYAFNAYKIYPFVMGRLSTSILIGM